MAAARILLVEDEALVSFAIEATLADAGYEVVTVRDGAAALVEFERDPARFHCILTDVRMPGRLTGWDVADRARELRPDIPVIYTTGDTDEEWATRGVPGSSVLSKPFKLDDAVSKISQALK